MQRKNRKFLKLSGLFFSPCSTWWNILLSGRNRNAASCTLPTFTMRKSVTTGKHRGCTSSIRRKYCHISIKSISPLARQNTKISSASCSIKVVVKARFVSLKTPLETRSKGARSLYAGPLLHVKTWCLPAKTYSNLHLSTGASNFTQRLHTVTLIYMRFRQDLMPCPKFHRHRLWRSPWPKQRTR